MDNPLTTFLLPGNSKPAIHINCSGKPFTKELHAVEFLLYEAHEHAKQDRIVVVVVVGGHGWKGHKEALSGIGYILYILITSNCTFGSRTFYYAVSLNRSIYFLISLKKNLRSLKISLNTARFALVKATKPLRNKYLGPIAKPFFP